MSNEENPSAPGEDKLPPVKIHETENYITAIIGGDEQNPDQEAVKVFSGFLDMLPTAKNDPLMKEQLLDVLKDSKAADELIIAALESDDFADYHKELIAMCWEAAIDMTPHLGFFAKLAAESDDPFILLEIQTVMQDMDLSDSTQRKAALDVLVRSLSDKKEDVSREILNDLIAFIESRD